MRARHVGRLASRPLGSPHSACKASGQDRRQHEPGSVKAAARLEVAPAELYKKIFMAYYRPPF